jgi:diguanylate cyclase (GGDEF)-like protein
MDHSSAGGSEAKSARGGPDAIATAVTRQPFRMWALLSVGVLLVGIIGAMFAAESVADHEAARSRQQFATSSADVASTLQLAIQHEEDLITSAGGFIVGNSDVSNAKFAQWTNSVRALPRYPELEGFGYSVLVPASQLAAFAARATADPSGPLGADGKFHVVPPGARPFYCLIVAGQGRGTSSALPAGFDLCAGARPQSLTARDSGRSNYVPIKVDGRVSLSITTPLYRDGAAPTSIAARRAEFLGWLGMSVSPGVVLDRALLGHPNMAVTFRYQTSSSDVEFVRGSPVEDGATVTTDLHNGWVVSTFGAVKNNRVLDDSGALGLLLGGIVFSALLAALFYVLATGRLRALRLVEAKTAQLQHQALHDALTGLPNRTLITDRVEQLLARGRRNGTLGAALFVDLDEFTNVNDTLGHASGDHLLQSVATRLGVALRDVDTIGRMGGDEFVILVEGTESEVGPELVAQRVLDVMRQPFDVDGAAAPMLVTASIGVAVGDREVPGDLLRDADVALYLAKAAGKNCYEVFRPEMETHVRRRFELEVDLRSALEGDQFRLVYQPIYTLDDLILTGVEALIRWDHPVLGVVQPNEFIPLLEASGQIVEVGRWVLHEACAQMAQWRARGSDLVMSVNVSSRQLDREGIVEHVREALDDSGLDPSMLTIEITETALMRNVDTSARRLRELKLLGVMIAVDDFGTGYSSLAYLQRLPVDCLKIDRAFISAMADSPESDALIHTLVQLGRDLGLRTLAEGVETTLQIDRLRVEQVDEAQGFLLARPLDPSTLEAQLLAPNRAPVR